MKKTSATEMRNFHIAVGTLLSLGGVLHLTRLIYGWDLAIDGYVIPRFLSVIGVAVALYLAHKAFKLA